MLYVLQIEQKEESTETYIFGTKLLLTLGVEMLGKKLDPQLFTPLPQYMRLLISKHKCAVPLRAIPLYSSPKNTTI